MSFSLLAKVIACLLCLNGCLSELRMVYHWDKIKLSTNGRELTNLEPYIPENNIVHRLRIWNNTLYFAVPRFRPGVPATLCQSSKVDVVEPYPSLGFQTVGNCFGLQNIKDIEVDHLGQLWALDVGKVNDMYQANYTCDPKLVVIDLRSNKIVRSAILPKSMFTIQSVLSGLTIDLKTMMAIITDLGPDPGFIAYNFQTGIYQKFSCQILYGKKGYDEAQMVVSAIDSLLYFTTVQLDKLYTIPMSVFDASLLIDVSHHVNNQGFKPDKSTAMTFDTAGNLFLAMPKKIIVWNTLRHNFEVTELYTQDIRLEWITSLAFDTHGFIWITTSAFRSFLDGSEPRKPNMKIYKRYCGTTAFALQGTFSPMNTSNLTNSANRKNIQNIYTLIAIFLTVLNFC
ncbi:major royal jelly protein 1-like [Daktulosphaira vitifoliae]|uniref:major royal jelly protein 1-like n=1 Tax=Daktulosphaira vitifoliae TaxID=58002 RepID=UPI0021A9E142|nr:major royal jelly protein 1-like [Daktulosphaira vitifoliae]